ncbi:MAG: hypothetical protein QOJ03_2796 [Frankiaceae bacterium]|nr:hypothetical protein [Frankiaceae bacterium]
MRLDLWDCHGSGLTICDQRPWSTFEHCRDLPPHSRVELRVPRTASAARVSYSVAVLGDHGYTVAQWIFTPTPHGLDPYLSLDTQTSGVVETRVLGRQLPAFPVRSGQYVAGGSGLLRGGSRVVIDAAQGAVFAYTADVEVHLSVDRRWWQASDPTEIHDQLGDSASVSIRGDYAAPGHAAVAFLPCAAGSGFGQATLWTARQRASLSCQSPVALLVDHVGARPIPRWRMRGSWAGAGGAPLRLLTTAVD